MDEVQEEKKVPPLFDSRRSIPVSLKLQKIDATVRFPTDQEASERGRGIKTILQKFGVDGTITKVEGLEESDAKLYLKLRVEGPVPIDEADASLIIQRLLKAEAGESHQEGDTFRIPVVVVGCVHDDEVYPTLDTMHVVRIPSEKEIRKYRRSSFAFVSRRHGREEMRTNIESIGDFYDSLLVRAEGYAPESKVPVAHKLAVVGELIQALEMLEADDKPESF